MTHATDSVPALRAAPHDLLAPVKYLGPAPLIDGEDAEAYNRILEHVSAAVKPKDIFEQIWVRDIVDLTWDALRWRRLSANFLNGVMRDAVLQMLCPIVGSRDAAKLADGYSKYKPDAPRRLEEALASVGLSMDALAARAGAHGIHLDRLERLNNLIAMAETRRNNALQELSRHRKGFAELLRKETAKIEDAEYDEIPAGGNSQSCE